VSRSSRHPAFTGLTLLLGIVLSFAFQTGHFLLGALCAIAYGLLLVVGQKHPLQRVVGGAMILFGLYVLALVLGLLAHAFLCLLA
jgi:uncharacterized membrane protein